MNGDVELLALVGAIAALMGAAIGALAVAVVLRGEARRFEVIVKQYLGEFQDTEERVLHLVRRFNKRDRDALRSPQQGDLGVGRDSSTPLSTRDRMRAIQARAGLMGVIRGLPQRPG